MRHPIVRRFAETIRFKIVGLPDEHYFGGSTYLSAYASSPCAYIANIVRDWREVDPSCPTLVQVWGIAFIENGRRIEAERLRWIGARFGREEML